MSRYKTFDATGIAPNGRLYAGDMNAIQDMKADQANFAQTIDLATVRLGDSAIQLVKYGTLDARFTSALRTDGILRALGGLYAGTFTTAQRDAIAAGSRPYGLIILNTTTNQIEWNKGSDAAPNWQPVSVPLTASIITNSLIATDAVDARTIQDGVVGAAELSNTLKPSVSAAPATEALRALGTGVNNACAGNDIRLTGVSNVSIQGGNYTLALADAGGMVRMNVGGANTLTVPSNGSVAFPVGTIINVMQYGPGNTTIAAAGGVTLRYTPGLRFIGQFALATLVKLATDEWAVSGNLAV